jgi:SAM-dependent methyltransferase
MQTMQIVGSDLDNFACPRCGCYDRERHLLLYLRRLQLLEKMHKRAVLHFAPEDHLTPLIDKVGPSQHVLADLCPSAPGVEKIDILQIPYADCAFDFVIANHVLEHVYDDTRGLEELYRVLRPGGFAILQTPFSNLLENTLCDDGVRTPRDRLHIYGQEDHVRLYGKDIFTRFAAAGFISRVASHDQILRDISPGRYGVNRAEPLFLFERGVSSE